MSVAVRDIIQIMQSIAPVQYAESWDNVGLQIGHTDWSADSIGVALDPLLAVVEEACNQSLKLLITHHPLFFRPISSIDFGSPLGRIIKTAADNRLSILTAHTNYDSAASGLNDVLVHRLKLKNPVPLSVAATPEKVNVTLDISEQDRQALMRQSVHADQAAFAAQLALPRQSTGIGRVCEIASPMSLKRFAAFVKKQLNLEQVRVSGDLDLMITKAAVCTGSGSSLIKDFFRTEAQVYISGDFKYHDARDIQAAGRALIDVGHFGSEHIMVDALAQQLAEHCSQSGLDVQVVPLRVETDPFLYL